MQEIKMFNRRGAANYLNCSIDLIAKAVEDGRIKCAWIFDKDGKLVRRPIGPGIKKTSQGIHFFEDELKQYKVKIPKNRVTNLLPYNFDIQIQLNDDKPDIYTTQGVAKILGVSYVWVLAMFKNSKGTRLNAHYYDSNGVLQKRSLSAETTKGRLALFFREDIEALEVMPRGRPATDVDDPEKQALREYNRQYYTRTRGRTIKLTEQEQHPQIEDQQQGE
jgi:hypothetical protein